MTADPITPAPTTLEQLVDAAHHEARIALDRGATMDAVVWLSAHLAAVGRTLVPAAQRLGNTVQLRRHDASVHRLQRLLRVAERRHSGDALAAALDAGRLARTLLAAATDYQAAEHALLCAVTAGLSADAVEQVAASYQRALQHAPTRPHPHAPHHGLLGAIAFRVDAVRDRVMDTMDSRHVPVQRAPQQPAKPGVWGSYLLGRMTAPDGDASP